MIENADGQQQHATPVTPDATSGTPLESPDHPAQQPVAATPSTSAPAQQPGQPQTAPKPDAQHPLARYQYLSRDGKHGWDGQQWVPIGTISNTPPPPPIVQKASVLRQVAETLAGGQSYRTSINPDTGQATRTPVPMSKTHIGLAIALTALSGGLSGLAATGPGAEGKAAAMGVQQGQEIEQQRKQQQQQQDQQAQQDANNQFQATVRKAQAFEAAQRAVLNTAQAERYGVESLKDAVSINSPLLSSYQDAGAVQESSISQDALSSGITSGKYDPTREIAVPDGFTNINGRYEQTFSIINNPSAKVPLTSEQAKAFADAGIPGWAAFKSGKVPDGYQVSGTMLANANAQLQAIGLMKQDVSQVTQTLSQSDDKTNQALAKTVPDFQQLLQDKNNGPVLRSALIKFQK